MVRFGSVALAAAVSVVSMVQAFVPSSFPSAARVPPATCRPTCTSLGMASVPSSIADPFAKLTSKFVETEQTAKAIETQAVKGGATEALGALDTISSFFDGLTADAVQSLPTETVREIVSSAISAANEVASTLDASVAGNAVLAPVYLLVKAKLAELSPELTSELGDLSPAVALVASAGITYGLISTILSFGKAPPPRKPYPMNRYDAASARAYFDNRLGTVIARGVQVTALSAKFGLGLLSDYIGGKLDENADQRAMELSTLLAELGPSFIKIGQSLSIRTDLLSPAYVRGLKSLQDQVPPFPTEEAKEIIEEELGQSIDSVFSEFSAEPVAAASLGQVFRAKLREDGREVAVKVQRPDIMEQIALDMHLIRETAPVLKRTFNLNTDLAGTVDAWGLGFVDELDYISEARNAEEFTESIQSTPLAGVVYAPSVIEECTTGKVLTTEWVIGERLDKSSKGDVTVLCSIAMNTYLTMMLETGTLHCDPHPYVILLSLPTILCFFFMQDSRPYLTVTSLLLFLHTVATCSELRTVSYAFSIGEW